MKKILLAFMIVLASGCTLLNTLGDYIDDNPVMVNIATSQVVSRYIEKAGSTVEAKQARAADFQLRVENVLLFVDSNPDITVDGLLATIDSSIDWKQLSVPDRILVSDIVALIEIELRQYELQGPTFNNETKFTLRALLNVAIRSAGLYL